MKMIMAGLGLLALALGVTAAPVQALISKPQEIYGAFIRPELKITPIKSKTAELFGGALGTSVGHELYLGLGGYALINSVKADAGAVDLGAFDIWYTGIHADYTIFNTKLFHGSLSAFVGGGRLHNNPGNAGSDSAGLPSVSHGLFVTEPDLNLEFNLTSTLELGVGIGYRFVNGSGLDALADSELSDWVGTIFFRWTED